MAEFAIKTQNTILKIATLGTWAAISGTVTNTGVDPNRDGRKIIPAGTPIKASANTIREDRATGIVTTGDGDSPEAILFHDTDVTDGPATATLLLYGIIDDNKVTISATLKGKLATYGFTFVG